MPQMNESFITALVETRTRDTVLGAEAELLLCCADYSMDSRHVTQAQRLLRGSELDWKRLLGMARLHRVVPLVYRNLSGIGKDLVPPDVLGELRQYHLDNTVRNLSLTREMLSILNLFGEAGISVVPFKGPVLAHLAYGNVCWREFDDLDILVPQEHVLRAV